MKIGDVYYEKNTVTKLSHRNNTVSETLVERVDAIPQKWIPISERLPEDEVEVLIYTTDKEINKAYRRIQSWTYRMEWLVFETRGYGYTYKDDEVLAWMPLPEPYKEESEG